VSRASIRELLRLTVVAVATTIAGCADSPTTDPGRGTTPAPIIPTPSPLVPAPPGSPEFIYVTNADGTGATRLTKGGQASWSPDGRRIVFHRYPTPSPPGLIYVIDVDGSNERELLPGEWPSWSSDGKRIVFADGGGLEVMDADGSNDRHLLGVDFVDDAGQAPGLPPLHPVWSPDGKRIAFERGSDWESWPSEIFVMNTDGTNLHRLSMDTHGPWYSEYGPAWSPDGRSIAYWSYSYGIAITDADGGTPRSVFADPHVGSGSKPAWSPDGGSLAVNTPRDGTRWITILSLRTKTTQLLISDAYDLTYSPDGKRVAFTSTR